MIARVLPREEWDKLEEESLPALYRSLLPPEMEVVVVEDEGKILARMLIMRLTHLEGVWIDPEHKGVAGPLLRETFKVCSKWQDKWLLAGVADDKMRGIITRMGGHKWPAEFYVLGG